MEFDIQGQIRTKRNPFIGMLLPQEIARLSMVWEVD